MNNNKSNGGAIATIIIIFLFAIFGIASFTSNNSSKITTNASGQTQSGIAKNSKTEKAITISSSISYNTVEVNDDTLEYGKTEIKNSGSYGEKVSTFKVTYTDGKETSRELIKEETTKQPTDRVIAHGTKVLWHCIDATSYDKNPYNDNKCTSSTGEVRYVPDSTSRVLDPSYTPGTKGDPYYNRF